ncbi:MAG: hypothetical protein ACM3P1_09370 [Candidatus Saccharibacteria bacterium]
MSLLTLKYRAVLLFLTVLCTCFSGNSQPLHLLITGDSINGFFVNIYEGNQLLLANTEEFSMRLTNTDGSASTTFLAWKGAHHEGNDSSVTLTRDSYLPDLDARLSVSVSYEVINPHIVKKTIRLFQPSMPDMYYILRQTYRPAKKPLKYITFEHDNYPGGLVHEMFPSAGWVTPDNRVVGILTDAGFLNEYTRTTRRRYSGRGGGFVGMRILPDPALYEVATEKEQALQNDYVRQTFGEMLDLDAGTIKRLKVDGASMKTENAVLQQNDSIIMLSCHTGARSGIEFITPFEQQKIYTISFQCKGNTPLALKLFRLHNGVKTTELEEGVKYIDNFPATENEWTTFQGSILVPYIENDSVIIFIGTQSGRQSRLQIKNLQFSEHQPPSKAYNLLPMGQVKEKITYLFIDPYQSHREFMISSQTRLSEGKGFKGTEIEKMMYANFNMLTWITSVHDLSPFNVPNMNYSPDMYNRDSFFSTVATYNKELNLKLWEAWGNTQTAKGGIGTIITPYMGSVEAKDNEATIEWLIWAMLNKRRFGITLPKEKIQKAVDYVINEFDSVHDGKCRSHFSLSQIDIVDFKPKTDRLGVNQGMLAIALRTIKELGYPVSEDYIKKVEQEYRNFYDPKRGHLLFDRNFPDIISLTDLEPEFFSLWLFNRPILTDQMVINHLDHIPALNQRPDSPHPEMGTTAPICVHLTKKGFTYLSAGYQPFAEFGQANYSNGKNDGFYYNGGSWLRAEYCAYVTGLKHGWKNALGRMENRIWAEINLNPDWPFSKEFIPTKYTSTDQWWVSTKGLCWNVFLLMANEVAGLRTPDMDPDYQKK